MLTMFEPVPVSPLRQLSAWCQTADVQSQADRFSDTIDVCMQEARASQAYDR